MGARRKLWTSIKSARSSYKCAARGRKGGDGMEYFYGKASECYANALAFDEKTGKLSWQCSPGRAVFLVQTPYDVNAETLMEKLCAQLNRNWRGGLPRNRFVPILEGVSIRYVSAEACARDHGCALNGRGSAYTVFPCEMLEEENRFEIYEISRGGGMISPRRLVPLRVQVKVGPYLRKRWAFGQAEETGYYSISLLFPDKQDNGENNYRDGDLEYHIRGISIPITRQMADMGTFYIHADSAPEVVAWSPGIRLSEQAIRNQVNRKGR